MVKKDLIFHWLQKCKKVDLYVAIFLPTNSAYRRESDETNCISFLIKDYELLENSMKFGKKAKNSLKEEFYSEPVYSEKISKS